MIVSFLNQKGGVGKTTLAVHTAAAVALAGHRVVLVDADPQGSALDWLASREAEPLFPVVGMPRPVLHRQVADLAAGCDLLVIDGPPTLTDIARSAMLASDLVLIPVTPSPYDVWAAGELVRLIDEVRVVRDDLVARFVISRKIVGTAIGRDVEEALKAWPSVPVLEAVVSQRVVFAETAASGSTAVETGRDAKAVREIEDLRDAVVAAAFSGRQVA
ncbi:MAG: AAA family ATPase [bacterium]|nr:AAA family ATPase [bacterium]